MEAKFQAQVVNGSIKFSGKGFLWPQPYVFRKKDGNVYEEYDNCFTLVETKRESAFYVIKRTGTRLKEDDSRRSGFDDYSVEWDEHYTSVTVYAEIRMYGELYAKVSCVLSPKIVDLDKITAESTRVQSERQIPQGTDGYWSGSIILQEPTHCDEWLTGHKTLGDRFTQDSLVCFTRPELICKYDGTSDQGRGIVADVVKCYTSDEELRPKKFSEL